MYSNELKFSLPSFFSLLEVKFFEAVGWQTARFKSLQAQLQVDFFAMATSLLFEVNYNNLLTQAPP